MGTVTTRQELGMRKRQADRFVAERLEGKGLTGHFLAVFDGHGGGDAAQYCAEHLFACFTPRHEYDVPDALRRAIGRVSKETRQMDAGTTLSVACVLEEIGMIHTAVIGDSPIIVGSIGERVWHSPKHNVGSNLRERAAAESRGARYTRDGYIEMKGGRDSIQLSRSLGDKSLRRILSDEPDMFTLHRAEFVLVASDGIADMSEDDQSALDELAAIAADEWPGLSGFPETNLNQIMEWRRKRGPLNDNVSVLLWQR